MQHFRVWLTETKQYIAVTHSNLRCRVFDVQSIHDMLFFGDYCALARTVEFGTGVEESARNGKEIFVGDIVRTQIRFEGALLPHQGEVVYKPEWACFCTKNEAGLTPFTAHVINDRVIIGNVHSEGK